MRQRFQPGLLSLATVCLLWSGCGGDSCGAYRGSNVVIVKSCDGAVVGQPEGSDGAAAEDPNAP